MPPFVSSAVVVLEAGRILAVLDPVRKEPVLPGGHLRWRETPQAGVTREVHEETGLLIKPGRLINVVSGETLAGEPGIVRLIYEASIRGGELQSSSEGEAIWLPVDEFLRRAARDGAIVSEWLKRTGTASLIGGA